MPAANVPDNLLESGQQVDEGERPVLAHPLSLPAQLQHKNRAPLLIPHSLRMRKGVSMEMKVERQIAYAVTRVFVSVYLVLTGATGSCTENYAHGVTVESMCH